MPSGCGAIADGPPGNGNFAPVDKRTSLPFASATTGTPELPNATAPIQVQGEESVFETGFTVKVSAVSEGAGEKSGGSMRRKCVNGSASSPGGALNVARLSRNSGTRMSVLRRKVVRVAAARGLGLSAAACRVASWALTSGGQFEECVLICDSADLSV